jgi:hypothetical protein
MMKINATKEMIRKNKRGQITLFIIFAIVVVAVIIAFFVLRGKILPQAPEKNLQPVYDYYLSCLEDTTKQGISILGEQGGYIDKPIFVPGSEYRPFSSQLNFLGQGIPYWLYVSGNNILKEQVPSKSGMEKELSKYIRARIKECNFDNFAFQGFDVSVGDGDVQVSIGENAVNVKTANKIRITWENLSQVFNNQEINVQSKLGKFYRLALLFYNKEKKEMIVEKYALDVMRLYAPVAGSEISCTPKVFIEEEIQQNIKDALQANMAALKLKGTYFTLTADNKYFVTNIGENINDNVNFMYDGTWPARINMYGDKIIEPVGLQQGLGILGFCYVQYQFVYDINFPLLVQFYDGNELFQFPIAVIIEKNRERTALPSAEGVEMGEDVCAKKTKDIEVYTYDSELNPIEANIKFSCINSECNLGKTEIKGKDSIFSGKSPACVNGFVLASAPGYADAKYQISTNEETTANILMKKLYSVSLGISLREEENAIISFSSPDYSTQLVYPASNQVQLAEGNYNISVYIYNSAGLSIPAISTNKCIQLPKSGIAGIFSLTEEKCFPINLPAQEVQNVVTGGGKSEEYLAESQLAQGNLTIGVLMQKTPATLEEVQNNYNLIEDTPLELNFE